MAAVITEEAERRLTLQPVESDWPAMTEEEFVAWCDEDTRAEFVDGRVIFMSPVSIDHSLLFNWLSRVVGLYVEQRVGGVTIGSEVMIRLRPGLRRLPDLLYISAERQNIVQRNYIEGAPDAIFEIVSPDSITRDWREKFLEYQEAGVREYWVIDPVYQRADLYRLSEQGKYETVKEQDGYYVSEVISGLRLKTDWFWQKPLPNPLDILRELGAL